MNRRLPRWLVASLMLFIAPLVTPAAAITAGDVLDEMEPLSQAGFIQGAVDMASHLFAVNGDTDKASCAVEWMFGNGEPMREVFAFFEAHKEQDAVALLHVLVNRKCGN